MRILGFAKMTMLDFPGRVACTVFTGGCNLRCPFCHNAGLVEGVGEEWAQEEIFAFLKKRRGLLDGVAVTGGEPMLQKDLCDFLSAVRSMGFATKVDTNGTFPDRLARVLELGLADYVAMDIKNTREKYAQTVGLSSFDFSPVASSISLLAQSGVDHEFRTTVVSPFHTVEDIEGIASLIPADSRYFLQNFEDSGSLLGTGMQSVGQQTLVRMLHAARTHVPDTALRGVDERA